MSPAYVPPPSTPPAICQGAAFSDLVGTAADDRLQAPNQATRVWGLAGNDILAGSANRAACLLGGAGNDVLILNGGGGVAFGGTGRDRILGSDLGDVIDPGKDPDLVVAAGGDDKLTTRDGRPEVVDCGTGADIVKGDRSDLLIGCESTNLAGRPGLHLRARPNRVGITGTVRVRLPARGDYQVLYVNSCRTAGQVVGAGKGRILRIARPDFGWCRGRARLAVIRDPGYGLPVIPVARFAFTVR